MSGPVIPADQWPEGTAALVWEENGTPLSLYVRGEQWRLGHSGIPMPAGHDWRVPVMRPTEQAEPVAWISPEQLAAHKDRPVDMGRGFLPVRLAREGLFNQPLYAAPQPSLAIDLGQFRDTLERAANVLRYAAHPQRSPHADELAGVLVRIEGVSGIDTELADTLRDALAHVGLPTEGIVQVLADRCRRALMGAKSGPGGELQEAGSDVVLAVDVAMGALEPWLDHGGDEDAPQMACDALAEAFRKAGLFTAGATQGPAIDLGQFRLHLKRSILLLEHHTKATDAGIRAGVADARRLLALIDGQADDLVQACQRDQSPAPGRIWLQIDPNESPDAAMPASWVELAEVTWCADSTGGLEVEYIRADLAHVQPTKGEGE